MTRTKTILAGASIAVVAATASVMMLSNHHGGRSRAAVKAQTVNDSDLITAIRNAGLPVSNLIVKTVGDITVLRGDAENPDTIAKAGEIVKQLGAQRVANLITVPAAPDDNAIRIDAERQLAQMRALDGCKFAVSCQHGVLKVSATVQSDMQADAARTLLNTVKGAQRVEVAFAR
ncbi:MAG: BON domain-containing protein [Thermoanaerobaculia bacterium]